MMLENHQVNHIQQKMDFCKYLVNKNVLYLKIVLIIERIGVGFQQMLLHP